MKDTGNKTTWSICEVIDSMQVVKHSSNMLPIYQVGIYAEFLPDESAIWDQNFSCLFSTWARSHGLWCSHASAALLQSAVSCSLRAWHLPPLVAILNFLVCFFFHNYWLALSPWPRSRKIINCPSLGHPPNSFLSPSIPKIYVFSLPRQHHQPIPQNKNVDITNSSLAWILASITSVSLQMLFVTVNCFIPCCIWLLTNLTSSPSSFTTFKGRLFSGNWVRVFVTHSTSCLVVPSPCLLFTLFTRFIPFRALIWTEATLKWPRSGPMGTITVSFWFALGARSLRFSIPDDVTCLHISSDDIDSERSRKCLEIVEPTSKDVFSTQWIECGLHTLKPNSSYRCLSSDTENTTKWQKRWFPARCYGVIITIKVENCSDLLLMQCIGKGLCNCYDDEDDEESSLEVHNMYMNILKEPLTIDVPASQTLWVSPRQ